ncbi:epimerase [Paenibacillus sp. CCS19]|uniref:NAD-dependent epimerase/dehydratase family protein n=1 Tax=Paenibacillus sp. CCS19 TaxID=3158387 RepID=UPI00256C5531|nr:NAD-dependent epimerase/dehydratase family protein [Paenibacillus cellulosilyticus]GMK37858.1 epimerase [Paenibacillus cellulosilyticus]
MKKLSIIVTGATGMVGEGVLHECLQSHEVERVLVINRRPCGVKHPKLTEIVHQSFHDLAPIEQQLTGFNACFFCLGVSSVGMSEAAYRQVTYDLTMHVASTLVRLNPDMVFTYVTGMHTDSTEKGKSMWARVKGKTENDLMKLPFKAAYMFRPGYIHPTPGLKNVNKYYKYIAWMYPMLRRLFPKYALTLRELGQAMIRVAADVPDQRILEVPDIVRVAGTRR